LTRQEPLNLEHQEDTDLDPNSALFAELPLAQASSTQASSIRWGDVSLMALTWTKNALCVEVAYSLDAPSWSAAPALDLIPAGTRLYNLRLRNEVSVKDGFLRFAWLAHVGEVVLRYR
jgi:hypothetical protein